MGARRYKYGHNANEQRTSMRKGKKIVITGALGHIGSYLASNLLEKEVNEVVLIDNLEREGFSLPTNFPKKEYSTNFIKADLFEISLDDHFKDTDVVVHLAYTNNRGEHVNQKMVEKVAQACIKNNSKLVFPSTTSVYGSKKRVVDEACKEILPQTPHALSKYLSEEYLRELGKKGLQFSVLRFGTVFGISPGIRYDTAVNRFLLEATRGKPLSVWKTAWDQRRPYLYVRDCISAINLILKKDIFEGEVYNVVSENSTVRNVIEELKKHFPNLVVNDVISPIMNTFSYDVSISKMEALDFSPKGSLKKGIGETVEFLNNSVPVLDGVMSDYSKIG